MLNDAEFEKEEARLFSDENQNELSVSKGTRLVPSWMTTDFIAWLQDYHPEIRGIHDLSRRNIQQFIREFEYSTGIKSNFTSEEWLITLQQ